MASPISRKKLSCVIRKHRIFLLFLLVVVVSYSVRSFVCHRELAAISKTYRHLEPGPAGPFIPHTIESAMMFGYAQDAALGRGIPTYDHRLSGLEEIKVNHQFTTGLEYFVAWGYRLKRLFHDPEMLSADEQPYEDDPYFAPWVRFQLRLWASSVAGLIFLWLIAVRCPMPLALFGGVLHALAPAAIARYTGQDLVRGEFSLPLIMAVFAIVWWHFRSPQAWKLILLALVAFFAMATWDMCQIIFALWALQEILRLIFGGQVNRKRQCVWWIMYIAFVMAAIFIPYHRAHHLLSSPLLACLMPTVLLIHYFAPLPGRRRVLATFGALLIFALIWQGLAAFSGVGGNYGHFGRLLMAKLRFNNVKPSDPRLLDFDARILWTPAMHSANSQILRVFFPLALYLPPLFLLLSLFSRRLRRSFRKRLPVLGFPLFMTVIYVTGFFYIVRYHVFAILFICLLLPLLVWHLRHCLRHPVWRFTLGFLLVLALLSEANRSYRNRRDYTGTNFEETAALVHWLRREGIRDRVVLAYFDISPALKAYCGAKIILQPKFELQKIRDYHRDFVLTIYGMDEHDSADSGEKRFRQLCEEHGAELFVFDRGIGPLSPLHIYSQRYMAAALNIPNDAPCNIFYYPQERRKLRGFYEFEPPPELAFLGRRYTVFKVISSSDYYRAKRWVSEARLARQHGNLELARRLAKAAVYADPKSYQSRILYAELFGKPADIRLRGW